MAHLSKSPSRPSPARSSTRVPGAAVPTAAAAHSANAASRSEPGAAAPTPAVAPSAHFASRSGPGPGAAVPPAALPSAASAQQLSAAAILPEDAVREEIRVARHLLAVQREVYALLRRAAPAAVLEPELLRQEEALVAAREAARVRATALARVGGFDGWLATLPKDAARRLAPLRVEARALRVEIDRQATQCGWLARRSAAWLEAQRALIADLATERLGAGTYGGEGRRAATGAVAASLLDRSV